MTLEDRWVKRIIFLAAVLEHYHYYIIPNVPLPVYSLCVFLFQWQHCAHMVHDLMATEPTVH